LSIDQTADMKRGMIPLFQAELLHMMLHDEHLDYSPRRLIKMNERDGPIPFRNFHPFDKVFIYSLQLELPTLIKCTQIRILLLKVR